MRIQEFLSETLRNIEDEIRYYRLKLRDVKVTQTSPIVKPYFTTFIIQSHP